VLRNGTQAERTVVRHAIEEGGKQDLEAVLAAIRRTGALDYARSKATAEATAATAFLDVLPGSECKDSLLQLASFSVDRTF
jgi:octaprenyl-diphosphate synthase